ncbi:MAG: hypothetical protein GJ677_07920 [Rhodobacteraceae bacterium]|nr:hypothetical protein [Paracoccaceae bacterium]
MVTNNKVLTVSYGTFSCTLEGFEESFDTMKAIAEYFRDLAADDRYFGAEPPTPDAEMLARIAEKEIARRVSARLDHGAIVLSAGDPKPETETQPVAEAAPAAQPKAEAQVEAQPAPQPAPVAAATVAAPVVEKPVQEQAAAPVVEDTPVEAIAEEEADAAEDAPIAEDVIEDAPESAEAPAVEERGAEDVVVEEAPVEVDEEPVEATQAEEPVAEEAIVETVEEAAAEETVSADDNIADSVMAAIAEDSLPEVEESPVADIVEEIAEDAVAEEAPVEAANNAAEDAPEVDLAGISAAVSAVDALSDDQLQTDAELEDDASDLLVLDAPVEDSEDPFADELAEEPSENTPEAAEWEDADDEPEFEENSIAAKLERIRAVVARVESEPEAEAVDAEDDQPELTTVAATDAANIFDEDLAPMDLTPVNLDEEDDNEAAAELSKALDDVAEDVEEAELVEAKDEAAEGVTEEADTPAARPLRARVVRMKKADFENAVASGSLEAVVDGDAEAAEDAPQTPEAPKPTSLTPEDEADLLAELAQVEAELKQSDAAQAAPKAEAPREAEPEIAEEAPVAEEPETRVAEEPAAPSEPRQPQPEPDLTRLMAKASSEMEEPQGKGRRSAIAHLRAAVAATRAEKRAGNATKGKDDTVAYRDDLASVVRAVPGGKTDGAKPAKPSAAPLKLVAAQRVDSPEQPAQQASEGAQKAPRRVPVRPRRVSSDQLDREEAAKSAAPVSANSTTLSGFIDYAKSVGATQLPESTEAAAAYLTFVEGLERFSRPMLMRMAREVNIPQFTREEGLRSFGQLLREKKIDKVAGGRFTANASINFKPRDTKAG